jgi:hypothetical protein
MNEISLGFGSSTSLLIFKCSKQTHVAVYILTTFKFVLSSYSFGNLHVSSVSNISSSNNIAIDVEQCSCGEAYQGSSCEVRRFALINTSYEIGVLVKSEFCGERPSLLNAPYLINARPYTFINY